MKKKKYVKPVLETEEFVPQEYIAACEFTPVIPSTVSGKTGLIYLYKPEEHPNHPYVKIGNSNGFGGGSDLPVTDCPKVTRNQLQDAWFGVSSGEILPPSAAGGKLQWEADIEEKQKGYVLKGLDLAQGNESVCFYQDVKGDGDLGKNFS